MEPFPITKNLACIWHKHLEPEPNISKWDKEPLEEYLTRNQDLIGHLLPEVLEQWVYRHWKYSPYCHIPLSELVSRKESWSTEQIQKICTNDAARFIKEEVEGDELAQWDFEPATTMKAKGTWNYPILILQNHPGYVLQSGEVIENPFWLIEGHLRFRYLRWIAHRENAASKHKVVLIEHPSGLPIPD